MPKSVITDLNRKVVIEAAVDCRPLNWGKCDGFQVVAQTLIDIGAKYGSIQAF